MNTKLPLNMAIVAILAMLKQQQAKTTKADIGNDTAQITFEFADGQRIIMNVKGDQKVKETDIWFRGGKQPTMTAMVAMKDVGYDVSQLIGQIDDGSLVVASVIAYEGVILSQAGITLRDINKLSPTFTDIILALIDPDVQADGTTDHYNLVAELIAQADINVNVGNASLSPSTIMHAEPARTDGAKLEHQMAAEIPDMGDDGAESTIRTSQMGGGDDKRQTVAA